MAAAKTKSVSAEFTLEKETKNKQRFKEAEGDSEVMGYCYADKDAMKALGNPKKIKVTIEPA